MDYSDVLTGIKNPEKEILELKPSFKDMEDIGRTIAAFSTKRGGKIYVGIDRTGVPIGTQFSNEISGKLHTMASNEVKPSANISVEKAIHDSKKDLFIACITVQKGCGVYAYKGVPYERRGDTNHPLIMDEAFELQKNVKKLYFDGLEAHSEERPALISDIDEEKIRQFLINSGKSVPNPLDIKRVMVNHSLTINGGLKVKNAAILLFGKNPQQFIPQATISICFFPAKTVTDNFMKKEFTGDLFQMTEDAFFEIRKHINVHSFVEEYKRVDIPDYPFEAIREALINAVVHRDYFDSSTEIFIRVFTDRIEIINPASFPFDNTSFEEIKKMGLSKRRNPIIADVFEQAKIMEREGRGLERIEITMQEHCLPPPIFEVLEKTFKITLRNASENPSVLQKSPYRRIVDYGGLNERQQQFIKYMEGVHRPVARNDYIKLLNVNDKTANRDLKDLVTRRIITPTGQRRWTRYLLN